MATEYKNILLKDSNGKVLLPITLSYYVEYKDGVSVKSYLDSLGSDIDEINEKIADNGEVTQNIINTINNVLTSYVKQPDYANKVVFDNTSYTGLSDDLKNLQADTTVNNVTFVNTQKAIETLDTRISYNRNYIDDVEGRLSTAETTISKHDDDIENIKNKIDDIFDDNGILDLNASAIKYTGTAAAGTEGQTNVQNAIDTIGSKLETVSADIASVVSQAGVTYVTGYNGILVKGTSATPQQGSVRLDLNVDNNKIIIDQDGKVTIDDSKLTINGSQVTGYISSDQIEGGLTADNITISYSYTDTNNVVHNDGSKTVQEFYDETQTTLSQVTSEVLDEKYILKVTDDQGAGNTYARVYTLQQGNGTTYTINIPKDQFLKSVEYVDKAPEGAEESNYPALVFTWNLPNSDATDNDTSYVPISSFIDAITNNIENDITVLQGDVSDIEDRLDAIESAGYITGVTLDGVPGTVSNGIVTITSKLQFIEGTSDEGISSSFLSLNGISIE